MIINRYKQCVGITLFRWFRYKVELWFCPKGFKIKEHCHPSQDIELIFIKGSAVFHRRLLCTDTIDSKEVNWWDQFIKFTVKSYHSHWFEVSDKMLVFLNIEKWHEGEKVTSAAKDFQLVNPI